MSIWGWIGHAAGGGFGALGALLVKTGALLGAIPDADTRRRVAFSMALIALAAKMAKADGVVTQSEVGAFRRIFEVPDSERGHVARLFDLAKGDIAGYDVYAARIAHLFADEPAMLADVLDGLFVIAKADGAVHERELAYLESVGEIFGIRGAAFERIATRHVVGPEGDPYAVLDAGRDWPLDEIRGRYRELVAENHPDKLIARGVPAEFIAIANDRMAAINRAWETIERQRRPGMAAT
ncbi:MAG TPA: TerB family tellurite resistance protein [Bauldia sp.]|nr:TerB family tellurite resistance protein [Bauldia sp.]